MIIKSSRVLEYAQLATWACILTAPVAAQSDTVRDLNSALCHYKTTSELGILAVKAKSNQLKWAILEPLPPGPATPDDAVYTLPFDRIGTIQHLGNRAFLVSGLDKLTSRGWILRVHLRNDPIAIVVDEQIDYGTTFDPLAVAYNDLDKRIYVYDETGKRIVAAPWQGGTNALPLAASFGVVFDSTSLPVLQTGDQRLYIAPGESGVRVKEWGAPPLPYTRVYLDGSVGKSVVIDATLAGVAVGWQVRGSTFVNARGSIELKGPAGVADLIELATGSVLYSFPNPGGDVWTTVPIGMELLIPGYAYSFKGGNALDSRPFRPLLRWGSPQKQGALLAARGILAASTATIGNQDFAISSHVRLDPPPQSATKMFRSMFTCS